MASAGTVTVDFAAETARFTAELRKVNQTIESVGGSFDSVAKIAKTAFAAVSFAALTSQLEDVISKSLELGGAISDATKKAGITAEAFSELNFAAKLSGVGTEDLSDAFKKFQTELANGGEKIRSLGVDLTLFRALQPDKQFEVLAEAINAIQDPAIRAGAAVEIFGKSGSNLLPLFEDGAKGIRMAREEAQRLGITLSTEQAQALDAAGDAVDTLKSRVSSLALTFTAALAPSIEFVTSKLQELLTPQNANLKELQDLQDQFDDTIKRRQALVQEVQQLTQRKASTFVPGLNAEFDKAIAEARQQIRVTESLLDLLNTKIKAAGAEAEAARDKANTPIPADTFDPKARTFGTGAEERAKELAKLNEQLNAEFDRNSAELNRITEELLQKNTDMFEQLEGRKTAVAIREAQRRAEAEQELAEFSQALAEEDARRKRELTFEGVEDVLGGLATLAQGEKKHSRFRQTIQRAEAIKNTAVGVARALDYPYPLNLIAAATTAAVGFKQVALIGATNESSGGGFSGGVGGFSGVSIGTQPTSPFDSGTQQQLPQAQPTVTQVVFSGPVYNTDETKQLIVDAIKEATDRDVIVINQRTAQAQMFMPAQ